MQGKAPGKTSSNLSSRKTELNAPCPALASGIHRCDLVGSGYPFRLTAQNASSDPRGVC